jgi:hypothetical protein
MPAEEIPIAGALLILPTVVTRVRSPTIWARLAYMRGFRTIKYIFDFFR